MIGACKDLRNYVGQSGPFDSWSAAAAAVKAQGPGLFPEFEDADWLAMARRTCIEADDGRIIFNYDPAISEGVKESNPDAVPPQLWALFENLYSVPVLLIRGEDSDILSQETAEHMAKRHPDFVHVNIPERGHAPLLTEPASLTAIRSFLDKQG